MRHYFGHGTAAVFAPLEPLGRAEQVSRRLTDAIELELLTDGTQLPGEIELAAAFGVATVTIREALADLRRRGLIETRRGRGGGSFVRTPEGGPSDLSRQRLRARSVVELRDMGDLYAIVSGGAAALAAQRSSADDVRLLRAAWEELAGATDAGARCRADARFRVLVAVAAQSPRLYRAEIDLQAEVGTLLWLASEKTDGTHTHRADLERCAAILDAIEERASERARCVAEHRVRDATARMIEHRLTEEEL
ncbi:FadR/GntR family transcriptional regulator [Nocardioides nematodiphilus]|uniref:FadR/GntR family transcriptional regulator n=1 Tax=Nocardioides nematodiphilus TaxID=2849669 RepID=UPI001CD9D3CF|nr:GntR family transcriptional regulator [Nocardioides nematodiphilus]MCA1984807.1 GntR family transcriptional regulator [Nocardioides nematodiphilus]